MRRKRKLWPWLLPAALAAWAGGAAYFYLAREKRFAAGETGVDVVSTDPRTGVTVSRDRRTGKIVVMDFNDVARDEVRAPIAPLPSWVPIYPRVQSAGAAPDGGLRLRTGDPVAKVVMFYEPLLGEQGIVLTREGTPERVTLTGRRGRQLLTVTVAKDNAGAVADLSLAER